MAVDIRRRDSTLQTMSLNAESAINLLDMSIGEDRTLSESVLDISRDPDITVTAANAAKTNGINPVATDLLGDATPVPTRAIDPSSSSSSSSSSLPPQPATSTHLFAPNIQPTPRSVENGMEADHVARLLIAAERIRAEREALYRQLEYLESETRIERRVLDDRLKTQAVELESQRQHIAALEQTEMKGQGQDFPVHTRIQRARHFSRAISALGIVVQHYHSLSSTPGNGPTMMEDHASESDQERDRLRDQIITLESELKLLQDNFQQLQQDYDGHLWACTGSSGASSQDADPRIQELEARIARRTERIGILQHDIKRLEWNLALAVEQIADLSAELDAATADKRCLMEDCTIARQERDAAREAIVTLENQCDGLQSENAIRFAEIEFLKKERESGGARMNTLESQCGLLEVSLKVKESEIEEISQNKEQQVVQALERQGAAEAAAASLEVINNQLSLERATHLEEIEVLKKELYSTRNLLELAESRTSQLSSNSTSQTEVLEEIRQREYVTQSKMNKLGKQCQELEHSLNTRCGELEIARQECLDVKGQKQQIEDQRSALQIEFVNQSDQLAATRAVLEASRTEIESAQSAQTAIATVIEQLLVSIERRRAIGRVLDCVDQKAREEKKSFLREIRVSRERVDTLQHHCRVKQDDLKKQEVVILTLSHELAVVQSDLRATTDIMKSKDTMLHQLRSDLQEKVQNELQTDSRIQDAENHLKIAINRSKRLEEVNDQLQRRTNLLEQERGSMGLQITSQTALLAELEDALRLTESRNNEAILSSREYLMNLECQVRQLDDTIQTLRNDLASAKSENADLRAIIVSKSSLEDELVSLKEDTRLKQESQMQEVEALQNSVQALETKSKDIENERMTEKTSYTIEIASREQELEELRAQRDDVLETLRSREQMLREYRTQINDLQDSQSHIKNESRDREAELERLFAQVQCGAAELGRSRDEVCSLQIQTQQLRKELSSASQASNTAQLEFDLQVSRLSQEITTLKKALGKYQQQPPLQEKVEALEARVEELEDLLQARCAEIEDNDDRFIEVLKERKKLNAKIETLNRKLHKLQKQLTEASDTPAAPTPPLTEPLSSTAHLTVIDTMKLGSETPAQPTPRVPPTEKMRAVSTKENHQPSVPSEERISSRPRPILRMPGLHTSPDAPISRKRPAPDDFDPALPSAAQPVVATSPARGLRKALSGLRSGFTPTRASFSQSPLKKKSAPSLGISDITNSPRTRTTASTSTAASRGRSWLGKIRADSESRPTSQLFSLPPFEPQAPFP